MRTQGAKVFASLFLITAFSSATLKAQLTVRSVGSVRHGADTQVTVVFSAALDQATATTPGNYTFPAGISVTGASLMTGLPPANSIDILQNPAPNGRAFDNQCVVLTVTGLAPDASTSVTIQNVKDTATPPNTIATTTINFKDSGYTWAESGTPALPGKVVAVGTNGFDIFSAGSAQWANYDEVVIVYKQVTGDFDLKARVEFQDFSSHWARAGVMAREALNVSENAATQATTASRYADVHPNPVMDFNQTAPPAPVLETGNNLWESHIRRSTGGVTGSDNATAGAPPYPNAWVRIQRIGNEIKTYHGADGVNWDDAADRTDADWQDASGNPLPLNNTLYVGPAYGPETGNIAQPTGQGRRFLYQVRFNALDIPYLRLVDPNPVGVLLLVEDSATSVTVDTSSVRLTFDTNSVTAGVSKAGTTTTVAYKAATPFAAGSSHSITLTFTNSLGNPQALQRSFTTPAYQTIPASYAVASATNPGFNVRPHQIDATRGPGDENSLANAEEQAADGFADPTTGQPYPNTADLSGATGGIVTYSSVINWNNNGTAYGQLNAPADIGNWRDTNAPPYNVADTQFPGMPGSGANNHNSAADAQYDSFVEEVTAYVQLKQGSYRMGVNSDDGFKASVAPGTPEIFGLELGVFDGGRGSADTLFDFVVTADGFYPFRLLWWNGAGGANLEWFTVNLNTGERILLNETGNPNSAMAFRTAQGRAYLKSFLPANGFTGVNTNSPIKVVLVNGTTTIVSGSIGLWVDGTKVNPTINSGATTAVSYSPTGGWTLGSTHTGTLVWGESTTPQTMWTNNFTFTTRLQSPDDLPANSFWIEAEDFDATGTPVPAAVNTMPYDVGGGGGMGPYDGIGATFGVDYNNNDKHENTNPTTYRSTGDPDTDGKSVDITTTTGQYATRRPGGIDMTLDYRIGWVDNGEWYNYTRKVPAGVYTAMAALSHGDPTGTAHRLLGKISLVTSGLGTPNQTLLDIGSFDGPSSGGWGNNNLVPMKSPDGTTAIFKADGSAKTYRFTTGDGDYDWFVFVPVSGYPPKVLSASPAGDNPRAAYAGSVKRNAALDFVITDLNTAVVTNTIHLKLDATDVTAGTSITKNGDLTTVHYAPPTIFDAGSTHTYLLTFADNGTPALTQTNTASFTVNVLGSPGQFLIEAEDFDYGGGQTKAAANTMPYGGTAYAGLGAVLGVDYQNNDGDDSHVYRPALTNAVDSTGKVVGNANMDQTGDTDRGTWSLTANYKIGWVDGGDWQNYTRTFASGTFQIWAALSYDDLGTADRLNGKMELVTSGVGTTNQTLTELGTFDAPGTGGWGVNALVPLKDSSGNIAALSLGGTQTLRYSPTSADTDYFLLVPATAGLRITSVKVTGGSVAISWTGTGTLEWTASLNSGTTWTTTGNSSGTFSEAVGTGNKFYRVKQ